ncbi:PREDICTED: DEAD-box ATP-dependent RNA helicase 31-like isoform X2 [Ipomoea nil]|uniref:DEAD-box ATP-dependent RNA helicase 31-like isoform X2 n=1 Tax=Ipomoea nil TaxID=35883 RepID=UPI000901E2E7|nr:PREDICTED: DEAD-box ATP-dependent RNA helicase 31-like isoform X2 [Ipomoea nil]
MPVKLFPQLCLLNSYIPITASSVMKSIPLSRPSRAIPILSRVFPYKLRYRPFRVALELPMLEGQFGSRKFSARAGRGGVSRGRSGSGHEVQAQKSLIDDEADLSDWVSGLRSDSYLKTRVYSDSDDESDERGGRRGKESGFDDLRRSNRQDVGQNQMPPSSRKGGRFGSEGSRKEGRFGSEGRSDRRNEGRDKMQPFARKEGRFGSEGRSDRRNEGHDKVNTFSRRGGRSEGEGRRGQKRGAEEIASGYCKEKRGSGGGIAKKGGREIRGKSLAVLSEDDDEDDKDVEDNGYKRFSDLIDSEEETEEDLIDSEEETEEDLIDSEEESEEASGDDSFEKETVLSSVGNEIRSQPSPPSSLVGGDSYLSETRFDKFSLSPLSLKGIKDIGYEKMTLVQEATFPVILKGKDVLAKAKTGTGKTVAFLLPSIEIVLKSPPVTRDQKRPPILVLVVCPTRELASQAAAEGNNLLKYHPTIGVQVVIGGTRLALEQKRMQANPCQILVATPGRLKDHIENTAGFATRLMGVKVLVLDEADHLLDMGFRRDIERIIAAIPKQRQTLLFSATIPPEVRQICHVALKRDHEFINTVEEGSEETHSQVQQKYLVAPLDKHFSLLYSMLRDHIADDVNYKVLVFCTTAMVTRLVAGLLGELNLNVREIHSRKPQNYRARVSDEFRKSKGLILVTSDVSARGVDYPDVTLVIQIGLPSDRQQYIHRLGRTGRKGKEGQGILVLAPWEEFFLSTIKDLPMTKADVPLVDPETKTKVERALSHVEMKNKEAAYQAWLGYYNSNKTVGRDKCRLVELANEFSRSMGLDNPPAIAKLVIGKMGLRNIPGLRSK